MLQRPWPSQSAGRDGFVVCVAVFLNPKLGAGVSHLHGCSGTRPSSACLSSPSGGLAAPGVSGHPCAPPTPSSLHSDPSQPKPHHVTPLPPGLLCGNLGLSPRVPVVGWLHTHLLPLLPSASGPGAA